MNILKVLKETHEVIEFNFEHNILNGTIDNYLTLFDFLGLPLIRVNWLKSKKVSPSPRDYIYEYDYYLDLMNKIINLKQNDCSNKIIYNHLKDKSIKIKVVIKNTFRKFCKMIKCN